MEAAHAYNLPFMRLLLVKDPGSLNMADNRGATALWHAVFASNVDGLTLLLKQPSIDVNHRLRDEPSEWYDDEYIKVTPLIWALGSGLGDYEIISPLVKHLDIDLTCLDGEGRNPLMLAILGVREDSLVRDILERRRLAIVAATASSGDPSATAIASFGSFDINAVDRRGDTALHIAAGEHDVESLKLLLSEDGININLPGHGGEPLLLQPRYHLAIEAILAHGGVEVDQVDYLPRTALSNAAARGDLESARVLLRYGARPDLPDPSGYTPIARAATFMHGDMVELLETAIGII
jgi:ankyrin repeat protein